MVRKIAGFTIIELIVVIGVIGLVGTIVLYGLSQYNNTQPLTNAQREFVTTLRSVQNQVINGADGVSVKSIILNPANCSATSCFYRIVNSYLGASLSYSTVYLPRGVQFSVASHLAICFSHPNLASFSTSQKCVYNVSTGESCNGSGATNLTGYICTAGTPSVASSPASFTVTFTQGSAQGKVILEGSGMKINRIYAP